MISRLNYEPVLIKSCARLRQVVKRVCRWPPLTSSLLSVRSCCSSLSSFSLASRVCCRASTFLTISCLCSLMATSSWASWGKFMKRELHCKPIPSGFMCSLRWSTPDTWNKRCVCVVPGLPVVGAPPVFPSGHYPCLTPHEFSLPTPSWCHCGTTHTQTQHAFIKSLIWCLSGNKNKHTVNQLCV